MSPARKPTNTEIVVAPEVEASEVIEVWQRVPALSDEVCERLRWLLFGPGSRPPSEPTG